MSDGISYRIVTEPFDAMITDMQKLEKRATMYAIRATSRYVAKVAKSQAPVYRGTDPRAMAESGNLKKSIKNARLLRQGADSYALKVGPAGSKKKGTAVHYHKGNGGSLRGVPLYRSQMEEMYGYMKAGFSAVESGEAKAIFEAAYAKAYAKYRR